MSKVIAPITAVVEFVTGIKSGQFGDYQSILFKTVTGDKIWKSFPPNSPEMDDLPVGTRVQLVETGVSKNGKPSHNVIILDTPTAAIAPVAPAPAPAPVGGIPDDVKRAIAGYVVDSAKLYAFCFSEATRALESQQVSEESVRCCASSLFIAAQKKFGL